eukprot:2670588-Rhodomonas_salina.1
MCLYKASERVIPDLSQRIEVPSTVSLPTPGPAPSLPRPQPPCAMHHDDARCMVCGCGCARATKQRRARCPQRSHEESKDASRCMTPAAGACRPVRWAAFRSRRKAVCACPRARTGPHKARLVAPNLRFSESSSDIVTQPEGLGHVIPAGFPNSLCMCQSGHCAQSRPPRACAVR